MTNEHTKVDNVSLFVCSETRRNLFGCLLPSSKKQYVEKEFDKLLDYDTLNKLMN